MTSNTEQSTKTTPASIGATVHGYPRIGRKRELKRALESYWAGRVDGAELDDVAHAVRHDALTTMSRAGLDSVPVNTFSWYDQVLDTSVLVGAVPARYADVTPTGHEVGGIDAATYFAMARGNEQLAPLEMSKWFDTNYHYLVPEISPETAFALNPAKPLAEFAEATALGVNARPVVVGPWTYLRLSKAVPGSAADFDPLDRLDDLVEVYVELLARMHEAGIEWVQIDEPAAVADLGPDEQASLRAVYNRLGAAPARPRILVSTYFADPVEALPALSQTPVDAIGIDLVHAHEAVRISGVPGLSEKALVLGAVNGRNIWRNDLRTTLGGLVPFLGLAREIAVSSSCSLLHVPYDVEVETALDPTLRTSLAFADQKLGEIVTLQRALTQGTEAVEPELTVSDEAAAVRATIPGLRRDDVRRRIDGIRDEHRNRPPQDVRVAAQAKRLGLPTLPTTTIGSYPQTSSVRKARADRRDGRIDEEAYRAKMRAEVADVIALQERIGLDVLVHGEPERNDMVQYFAEQLDGYAATELGWVQSYGSRCVRPPILFGDVYRSQPMTVEWTAYAQGLTAKPVKGMLTGPVTMLAWSFVRDDQPRAYSADQVALALRDEVDDLEAAGVGIVQVDEPALRELLPLRESDREDYLAWSVESFRLATSGVADSTQVHTHLCYSEFGEIIEAIDRLDADVTSIEAARSSMELLADLTPGTFTGGLGPGVYDIHSPRVPDTAELVKLLDAALAAMPADRLWVNPDCGLKTRGYAEVEPALTHMVTAAADARERLGTSRAT